MPALTCTKCSRANPSDAQYCYFDGVALGGAPAAKPSPIGQKSFSAPFTLPNGKQCQNFDQLAIGCQENWSGAVDALKQGYLEKFMASQGRADLAMAAREAARYPDKDRGLDQFLAKLPTQAIQPPKLTVDPAGELNLGNLQIGGTKSVPLKMRNQGMRLIYGSVTIENAPWLTLGSGAGANQKLFQFGSEMSIPVNIQGKRLRASNKPLEGKLIVDSNAGMFTIKVKAEVPVKPFPSGSLAGARSPRQVAEKAKASPKDSAPLFENGSVAQWYKDNGWTYPVKGASASGLGAVQQFFEALGLTPPPKVEVGERAVNFKGQPGEQLRHTLEVKAQEKRPVYAHATADQPWLEVGRARLNGRVATIPLTVSNVPAREGETLKAKLTVTANGNQRFVIPVTLTIGGAFNLLAPIPVGGGAPVIATTRGGRKRGAPLNPLPLILLLLCLIGVMIWDFIGKGGGGPGDPKFDDTSDDGIVSTKQTGPEPYDYDNRIAVSFTDETQRFGIAILKLRDPRYPEKPKLLTRYENGNSNNTCVKLDTFEYVFGRESEGVGIKWKFDKKLGKKIKEYHPVVSGKVQDRKYVSIMRYETERIEITQTVEIVVGEQTRLFDTALITYEIKNGDDKVHTVGIRAMIDTYIGLNDGTPFFIPPTEDNPQPQLVDTKIVLDKAKVPQFVRVLENDNLNDANATVAEMGLKIKKYEDIEKMVICRWPQEWGASEARWDWPYQAMNEPAGKEKDSCVVLYWPRVNMAKGEVRKMGYTYGLGRVGNVPGEETFQANSQGKIKLYIGPAKKAKPFVATAYVKNADGQTCTLKLPKGVKLVRGENPEKPVKTEAGKDYAVVSWRCEADEPGTYMLDAVLTDGADAKANARVLEESIFN